MSDYELHHGDMLEVMPTLAKSSVAMVFADLPYAITNCHWDTAVDLKLFWRKLPGKTTICSAVQPFTSTLVFSNLIDFNYSMSWHRKTPRGFNSAKRRPLRAHEDLLFFRAKNCTYNPIKVPGKKIIHTGNSSSSAVGGGKKNLGRTIYDTRYPTTVLRVDESDLRHDTLNGHISKRIHPTQKPVALLEWLIATYTNPGDTVLDPCFGSGTTGVACANLGRKFVGIEKDAGYFATGKNRIEKAYADAAAGPSQTSFAV